MTIRLSAAILLILFIAGCDNPRSNNQNLNLSIKVENLSNETQIIYSKIQENDKLKLKELIQKVENDDLEATKVLGFLYLQGKSITRNINKGLQLLEKSADAGDKEAASILYKIYATSKFKDDYKAKKYGGIATTDKEKDVSEQLIKYRWPDYSLSQEEKKRVSSTGSGVAINGDGYFLTNRHVVDGCTMVYVKYNGMTTKGISIILGQDADIAIIKVNYKTPAFINLLQNKPELGEKIFVGGYPITFLLGEDLKITDGLISGADSHVHPNLVQISASISSGNSGGPVVNENNKLIGIATMGIASSKRNDPLLLGHGINFATHSGAIGSFLSKNNVSFQTNTKNSPQSSKNIAESLKLNSSIVICIN